MKKLLATLGLLLPLLTFGQGTTVRSLNGQATNLTAYGGITNVTIIRLGSTALGSTFVLIGTNGLARFAIFENGIVMQDTNSVIRFRLTDSSDFKIYDSLGTNQFGVNIHGAFGNGGGLTNLASATNFPAGPTYVYHGKVTFNSNVVFVLPPIGDGSQFTNVLEKNVSVTTNSWGTTAGVVDFSRGTAITTNLTGDMVLTGIAGFVTSNWNWQTIDIDVNGATRLVTVPAGWTVSGFTNATTAAITNGTWAELKIKTLIGRATNASLEIFQ